MKATQILMDEHRVKDNILFSLADRVIPIAEHDHVLEGFEKVEHEEAGVGVHEKYLALVGKLEREVG